MDILKTGASKLGLTLNQEQLDQFEVYFREIVDWNKKLNLTSILEYEEVQVKHFLDSLTVYSGLKDGIDLHGLSVLDVGTGAGFPGIPLKIVRPEISLALLEATAKKTEFLTYITSTLGLKNTDILTGRAEDLARIGRYREHYDIVVSRAVAPLAVLAELTLPFCTIGGRCILPKKGDTHQEIEAAGPALSVLGGQLTEIRNIDNMDIEGLDDNRHLMIIDKIAPVPDKYPRRAGMPEKRPIK